MTQHTAMLWYADSLVVLMLMPWRIHVSDYQRKNIWQSCGIEAVYMYDIYTSASGKQASIIIFLWLKNIHVMSCTVRFVCSRMNLLSWSHIRYFAGYNAGLGLDCSRRKKMQTNSSWKSFSPTNRSFIQQCSFVINAVLKKLTNKVNKKITTAYVGSLNWREFILGFCL